MAKENELKYLKSTLEKYKALSKKVKEGKASLKEETYNVTFSSLYVNVFRDLFTKGLANLDERNAKDTLEFIYKVADKESIERFVNDAFFNESREYNPIFDKSTKEQIDELSEKFKNYFTNENENNRLVTPIHQLFGNDFVFQDDFVDKFFDNLPKSFNLDEIIPGKESYVDPLLLSESEIETYPHKEEIDSFIELVSTGVTLHPEYNNEEIKKALEDANKILSFGEKNSTLIGSQIAESGGSYQEQKAGQQIFDNLQSNENLRDKFKAETRGLEFLRQVSSKDKLDISTEIITNNKENYIDDDLKKKILAFNDLLIKEDIMPEQIGESGTKEYSLRPLMESKLKLEEAVKEHNFADIIKYQKEYRAKEKVFDKAIAMVKEMGAGDRFPHNINPSRERSVPAKYRNDFVNVSNFNALSFVCKAVKDSGIPLDEFLDNPISKMHDITIKMIEKSEIMDYLNTSSVSQKLQDIELSRFTTAAKPVVKKAQSSEQNSKGFFRGMNGLTMFIQDDKKRLEFKSKVDIVGTGLIETLNTQLVGAAENIFGNEEIGLDSLYKVGLIFNPKEDRLEQFNFYGEKTYDFKTLKELPSLNNEEITKKASKITNTSTLLIGTLEAYNAINEKNPEHAKSLRDSFKYISSWIDDKNKSNTYNRVASMLASGKTNNITKTNLANLKVEAKFEKTLSEGFTKSSVKEALNEIASLKNAHESRKWYEKIFYSSVREQNTIYDKMVNKLSQSGLSKKEINNAVDFINSDNEKGIEAVNNLMNKIQPDPLNVDNAINRRQVKSVQNDLGAYLNSSQQLYQNANQKQENKDMQMNA